MGRPVSCAAKAAVLALALFSAAGAASAQRDAGGAPPDGERRAAEGLLARQGEGSFEPVTFNPRDTAFGLRNNNWVGMKAPNLDGRWPGQTGANPFGFARFEDPAYSVRAFIDLLRLYHDRYNTRSAAEIMRRYSPAGDCSGAPDVSMRRRREADNCPDNQIIAPITARRAAAAVGLGPTDDLDLFGPNGEIKHPDRLRALLNAVVTQELGADYCPQPPRGESWIGCRVSDEVYNRAVELLEERRGPAGASG